MEQVRSFLTRVLDLTDASPIEGSST